MRASPAVALVAIAALLLNACGTVLNFANGESANYGGIQKDLEWMTTTRTEPLLPNGSRGEMALILLACIPAELCLSFFADTITLPLVMFLHHNNKLHDGPSG